MKKLIIVCVLILSASFAYCQTTIEEYNFITKGYKIQKESGLDMKKGYQLVDCTKADFADPGVMRYFQFRKLIRLSDKKVCALMVEYRLSTRDSNTITYYCIPQKKSNSEIWAKVAEQIRSFTNTDVATAYSWALIQYISSNDL